MKTVLVVALLTATGEPSQPPIISDFDSMTACETAAKATVEGLALAYEERAMPSRLPNSPFAAVKDDKGVWIIRYKRQLRGEPAQGEDVVTRTIRAVCRPAGAER